MRSQLRIALGIVLASLLLYVPFVSRLPTGYADSDELLVVGHFFGVAHPSGYPLAVVLIGLVQHLLFWLPPAFSGNLLSALFQALTLGGLYLLARRIVPLQKKLPIIAGLILLATSAQFWFQATRIEVHTLNNFLVVATLLSAFSWWHRPTNKWFYLTGVLAGVTISQVQTSVLIFPALLLIWWYGAKLKNLRLIPAIVVGFLLPTLLLLPLNGHKATVSWRFPQNLTGIVRMVARQDYAGFFLDENRSRGAYWAGISSRLLTSQPYYAAMLLDHFGIAALAIALAGLVYLWKKNRPLTQVLVLLFILNGPLLAGYMGIAPPNPADLEYQLGVGILARQLLLADVFIALFIIAGLHWLVKSLSPKFFIILVAILVAAQIVAYNPSNWLPFDSLAYTYSHQIIEDAKPDSVVICAADISCYNLFYVSLVEGIRPDVKILTSNNLYRKYYLDRHPELYRFSYQENPYYLANLLSWSVSHRPTYLTNPDLYYINYIGLNGNPFYLSPAGYAYQVTATIPESLPASKYNFTDKLLSLKPPKDAWHAGLYDYLANVHAFTGLLYAKYSRPQEARENFEYAISLKPTYVDPQKWLTQLPVMSDAEKYQQDPTQSFNHYYASASASIQSQLYETAYTAALKATYIEPENVAARLLVAQILISGNYKPEALLELQQVLILDAQNQQAKDLITSLGAFSQH